MQRAALRAKEIAAITGTPVVTWKDGKIHHDYLKLSEVEAIRAEIEKLK